MKLLPLKEIKILVEAGAIKNVTLCASGSQFSLQFHIHEKQPDNVDNVVVLRKQRTKDIRLVSPSVAFKLLKDDLGVAIGDINLLNWKENDEDLLKKSRKRVDQSIRLKKLHAVASMGS